MNDNSRGFYKDFQSWTLTKKMSTALEKEKKQVCPNCKKRNKLLLHASCQITMECPRCKKGIVSIIKTNIYD